MQRLVVSTAGLVMSVALLDAAPKQRYLARP
jgi:hypothetical protein